MRANSLVTGGAGFIGSHLGDELVKLGHKVTVLDDLSGGFVENVTSRAHFVQGSITDEQLVNRLFAQERYDYVFHLAAYAAEGLSHFIKRFNYTNNLIGSVNLINAAVNHNVKCFVFTSSIAVYGSCSTLPMTEQSPAEPEDPYGIAKLAVERELAVSRRIFGLNYIIFRPHNVYGERQNIGDRYRNVVGIFMNQIMQNRPMTIFGDGRQTRAFSYIGDVVPIIARSVEVREAYNEVFNVGAERPYSVSALAAAVARAMGVSAEIVRVPPRSEAVDAYSSHLKTARVFGAPSETDLMDGLSRMATWVKQHGARQSKTFLDIEISKGMPEVWKDATAPIEAGVSPGRVGEAR